MVTVLFCFFECVIASFILMVITIAVRSFFVDIVERFQLLVSLVLLFFYNISKHHINSFWVSFVHSHSYVAGVLQLLSSLGGVSFFLMQDEDWLTASEWMSPLLFTLFIIYLSELTVDWLKHTSIINFTDLGPRIYTKVWSLVPSWSACPFLFS